MNDDTADTVTIDADFPGGNIIVDRIGGVDAVDGDTVLLHQDLRDTDIDWFYWCFRVRGAEGRTLRFRFTESRAIGVRGPAVSLDEGLTWRWLGAEADWPGETDSFEYVFPPDSGAVRFSFGMPYQLEHWERFVCKMPPGAPFVAETLCRTRKGRPVPYARAGCIAGDPTYRVAVACRHHCCEMMADYALEGMIRWIVGNGGDDDEAEWFRHSVELLAVPFADLDGVEDGDQGKNRMPRDHGRDYAGDSIYPTTRAIRDLVPTWSDERLVVAVDIHCPHISGAHNEVVYLVGHNNERIAEQERVFSDVLERQRTGPLPVDATDFLAYGEAWNVGANRTQGKGFCGWAAELPSVRLVAPIEIPYANAGGAEVNQTTARAFGEDLVRALCAYLMEGQRT